MAFKFTASTMAGDCQVFNNRKAFLLKFRGVFPVQPILLRIYPFSLSVHPCRVVLGFISHSLQGVGLSFATLSLFVKSAVQVSACTDYPPLLLLRNHPKMES